MAQRYSVLPSNLLKNADSFDIMVYDVAVTYQKIQEDKANKRVSPDLYKQEDLQAIMDKVKNK